MNSLASVRNLQLEPSRSINNLTMFPLFSSEAAESGYMTLDEAISNHMAKVTEISESGSVSQLLVMNEAELPILILDGEELVGAKQNRIVNLTIFVPPKSTLEIPVTCVEAGRWHNRSTVFSTAGRAHYASARAMKLVHVSESMACQGNRDADQQAVWSDIARKSDRMGALSDTQAAAAMYKKAEQSLDQFVRSLTPPCHQVGAVFAIGGRITGLEVFDSQRTWQKSASKITYSYGLDALDSASEAVVVGSSDVLRFIEVVASAELLEMPAIGLGTDMRLRGNGIVGGALVVDGRLLHLVAFPATSSASDSPRRPRR